MYLIESYELEAECTCDDMEFQYTGCETCG